MHGVVNDIGVRPHYPTLPQSSSDAGTVWDVSLDVFEGFGQAVEVRRKA